MGRPKKYSEPTKMLLLQVPESLIERLDILSGELKLNRTDTIIMILAKFTKLKIYKKASNPLQSKP